MDGNMFTAAGDAAPKQQEFTSRSIILRARDSLAPPDAFPSIPFHYNVRAIDRLKENPKQTHDQT